MVRKGAYTKHSIITRSKFVLQSWHRRWKALSWKKKTVYIGGPIVGFLVVVPIMTYAYFYNDIRNQERLLNRNNTGVVLYDIKDKVIYSSGRAEHRDLVPLSEISEDTQHAIVASEDKNFYDHQGFSPLGVVRALYTNIIARGVEGGGSTITQQLAKNTLLSSKQTFLRKYQELTISMAIEQRYTKDEILTMYLNSVFFGDNAFGIEDGAKHYFDKKPKDLDLAESAMMIGVLPAPNAYSPITGNVKYAEQRQEYVLGRMLDNDYISKKQHDAALDKKLAYAKHTESKGKAPHFTSMVLDELYDKYGEEKVQRSGYQVKTTLDLGMQDAAQRSVDEGMVHINANGGSNAAVVGIEPRSGGIRTLIGSVDWDNKKFGKVDMTTTTRQPGSSFKPIYYADALDRGKIQTSTIFEDKETDFGGGYKPRNATRQYYGNVTTRQSLAWSLNIPSVKIMRQNGGADRTVKMAKDLGITSLKDDNDYGLSLALGSAEASLMEMTNAYATFANSGKHVAAKSIGEIRDKYDKIIASSQRTSEQVMSEEGAYLISDIMSDRSARAGMFGGSLDVVGTDYQPKNVAVKTGTTDDARDAWTIGYTPSIAVGVWVGNNDNEKMLSGGADMAGPIWRGVMSQAIGTSSPSFTRPTGVIKRTVCEDGRQTTDLFIEKYAPPACAKEKTKKKTTQKCQIKGKESLDASDPKCTEAEQCAVSGLEGLPADDPACIEVDDEDDGDDDDTSTGGSPPPGDDDEDDGDDDENEDSSSTSPSGT